MTKSHKKHGKKSKTYKSSKIQKTRKRNKTNKRNKSHKTRKNSSGGVGTSAQAAALAQAFQGLTNRNEYYDVISEVLAHQPVEERDEVERRQRRTMARANLDERLIELEAENIERERVIRDLLATINGTIEPDLVQRISRLGRPSHPLQRELRQRGQDIREAIQEEIENVNYVNRRNAELMRNAFLRAYPHLDPDNLPPGILIPPHRQLADPIRRYGRLLE